MNTLLTGQDRESFVYVFRDLELLAKNQAEEDDDVGFRKTLRQLEKVKDEFVAFSPDDYALIDSMESRIHMLRQFGVSLGRPTQENVDRLLEHLLSEEETPVRPTSIADFEPIPPKPASLDQAVDRYLVRYEREAIPTSAIYEAFLFEQEPGEEEEPEEEGIDLSGMDPTGGEEDAPPGGGPVAPDPAGGGGGEGLELDLGAPGDPGGEKEDVPTPVHGTPTINLADFARQVARLISNMQSLIDFESIIINRVELYIQNNYSEKTARELTEMLKVNYGLEAVDMTNSSNPTREVPERYTAVTGPLGG
jgi:hypothetical protein